LICNNIWDTRAGILCRGICGCPICGLDKAKNTVKWNITTNDFVKKLPDKLQNSLIILGNYFNQESRIEVKCKICDFIWNPKALYLIAGKGCHQCGHKSKGLSLRTPVNIFNEEIISVHNNRIEVISEYQTNDLPITYKCKTCNKIQVKKRASLLLNRGCSYCSFSKGELKIKQLFDKNNINYKSQFCFLDLYDKKSLRFDFAVFDDENNLSHLVEYDGPQHTICHKFYGGIDSFLKLQKHDKMKNDYCAEKNIVLIRISYKNYKTFTVKDVLNGRN